MAGKTDIITYYQSAMYEGLGVSDAGGLLLNAVYHSVAPLATLIFITFIVDSIGRKKPLIWGTCALPVLFIVFAIINSKNEDNLNKTASTAGIAIMFIYNVVFCLCWGPVGWTYLEVIVSSRHTR